MAWNPSPKVADCRTVAAKWHCEQVIILGIDPNGAATLATYGSSRVACKCAQVLGDVALAAIQRHIAGVEDLLPTEVGLLPVVCSKEADPANPGRFRVFTNAQLAADNLSEEDADRILAENHT